MENKKKMGKQTTLKETEKIFNVPFKKTVYGYFVVKAKNKEQALNDPIGECIDEVDNESNYELDEQNITEEKNA